MTKWVCQAVLDSFTVFFLPMAAYKDATTVWAERGYADGLYVFGTTVYAGLIMAMMMKVFNMTNVSGGGRTGQGRAGQAGLGCVFFFVASLAGGRELF